MYCFILSQVIFMRGFLVALNDSANAAAGNSTSKTPTENDISYTGDGNSTNKTAREDISAMATKARLLMWAVGLLVTELVSVLLIAWSLSILYRLACS
jgi:hypothetical protein